MASRPRLLRDSLPRRRPAWADLRDSSSEFLEGSPPPPAPVIDSQESYGRMGSMGSLDGGSRLSLQRQLEEAALLDSPARTIFSAPGAASSGSAPPGSALEARAPTLPLLEANEPPEALPGPGGAALSNAAETAAATMVAPPPARRRISFKRPPDSRTPVARAGGRTGAVRRRISFGNAAAGEETGVGGSRPLAEASEEDWQRRAEKRLAAVNAIKDTPEYRTLQVDRALGRGGAGAVPGTPDPDDRETSKRSWEAKVMQWRNAVKEWSAGSGNAS